jgi:hypothetical protein
MRKRIIGHGQPAGAAHEEDWLNVEALADLSPSSPAHASARKAARSSGGRALGDRPPDLSPPPAPLPGETRVGLLPRRRPGA